MNAWIRKAIPGPSIPTISPFSPLFAKRAEFEDALVNGHNLSERFDLPVKSEATVYEACEITDFAKEICP